MGTICTEWISVQERLPDEGEDVLIMVWPNEIPFTRIGHIENGVWYLLYGMWNDYYKPFSDNKIWPVTHWIPLPEFKK